MSLPSLANLPATLLPEPVVFGRKPKQDRP